MDRASGSGVFARDPDALLDLIELDIPDTLLKEEKNKAICNICYDALIRNGYSDISQDDMVTARAMREHAEKRLSAAVLAEVKESIAAAEKSAESRTAWRIEGTLREFPKFPPVNVWFDFPVHRIDMVGVLKEGYRIYGEGDWGEIGGLILPKIQIEEFTEDFDARYYGQDFGFNHANAILDVGFRDGEIYIVREVYVHEKDTSEIIPLAEKAGFAKNIEMFCDSAEPDRIKMWKKAGYRAVPVVKEKNSVHAQIDFLKKHKIHIHPRCVNTIKEIQQWRWKKDTQTNTYIDEPVEFFDDAIITDVAGGVNDVAQAVINASPQTKQLLTLTVAAAVAIPAVTKATALLTAAKAGYNTILTLLIPKQLTFGAALKATAGWIGVIGGALAIFSLLNDKTEKTKAVNDNATSSFKAEKKGADEAADGVDNLAESMDGLDNAVKGSLASVDKLNILRSSGTGSFTSGFVNQNDLDLLENAIGLTGDLKNEFDGLQNVKSIDWFSFLNEDELYNSLKRLNDLSRKLFGDEWTNHWNAVGNTIYEAFSHPDPVVRDNALQEIYGWLESLNNPIQEFFGDFGALWSETWQKVAVDFTTALEKAGSIFQLWDSEFRRIASEMYETFSGGKIDEIELHSKYSDLVQQIQLATNEYIRQGISAEKALAMAERDFLNSSEAVYYYENLAQNRRTLEEVQAAEQTIRMQGYDYTDMKTLDEFINASVVSADFANTRPDWVVYPQYVPTTGPQQELPPINIFMDGEEISYHVTAGQTREQTRSNDY